MEKDKILDLLYKKYIRPTERVRDGFIGVEIEMPIVNLNKEAVDFRVVHKLTSRFLSRFKFDPTGFDDSGNIYSSVNAENGDVFSYDCSYNNLELSFGKEKELFEIYRRFLTYYRFIQEFFAPYNYTLTGFGVNPYRRYNNNVPIENGRYKMLYHHLSSFSRYEELPMYFHKYPQFGMFSSASQVQLDVSHDNAAAVIDAFNKLEPVKAVLFGNSVLLGEHEELLCCRDMLWENSTHGINPHNIGMYDRDINSVGDLLKYISTASIYCVERNGKYLNFPPLNLYDYFNRESISGEYVENGRVKSMTFSPEPNDIDYLRTFKFEDLTFRGTVEFRSVCCQPVADVMSVAAFHVGLIGKADTLKEIFENDSSIYNNGYTAAELRKQLVQSVLPSWLNQDGLYRLVFKILDLSREGLEERGFGEEVFLNALYNRAKARTNPAGNLLNRLKNGDTLENIIKDYSKE